MIGIICIVNRVFRESLDEAYSGQGLRLTCTSDLPQPGHTFAPFVQTCIARCALEGIANTRGTCGRLVPVSLVPISTLLIYLVPIFIAPENVKVVRADWTIRRLEV